MPSKARKKFDEWCDKIRSTLERGSKSDLDSLPNQIKWLQRWARKLRKEEPNTYRRVKKIEINLRGEAGSRLSRHFSEVHLKEAKTHKKGTKVRLNAILRYVYHYIHYAHQSLISSRREQEAKTILKSFWEVYSDEIVKSRRLLDDYQIEWLLELIGACQDIGIELHQDKISKLRARAVKPEALFTFFNVKELTQMGEELSNNQAKWKLKKGPRNSLVQSIIRNTTVEEIEEYICDKIRDGEIPRIQANNLGWILGPLGLLKSVAPRKHFAMEGMTKFLFNHIAFPHPYSEIKQKADGKLHTVIKSGEPLRAEKICQLILVKLRDEEILEIFNKLIDEGKLKIQSIERYWDFVATPFGIFEPPYQGEKNLAQIILKSFKEEELLPYLEGVGTTEDLLLQKCTIEPPDKILKEIFGLGPSLSKLARKIGLKGLDKIENKETLVHSILLRLGFDVPPDIKSIHSLALRVEKHLKDVKDGSILAEGEWNAIYRDLESILEDLILFYAYIVNRSRLQDLEEDKLAPELRGWIRKTFKLRKQFDYLTFGDLCALLRDMNRSTKSKKKGLGIVRRTLGRSEIVRDEHLQVLDFIKGCRTELTKIHRVRGERKYEQEEALERLVNLMRSWISEKGLSRTYPHAIRLKEEVTTEFGVRYFTVVDEEGNTRKLKTDETILPEEMYLMISRNDKFPINPVLVRKFW